MFSSFPSSDAQRLRCLKDGFWEDTAVYEYPDGEKVVRKSLKPTAESAPWAMGTLRREIHYLRQLPGPTKSCFPPLVRAWGMEPGDTSPGFEIPFFEKHQSASDWLLTGKVSQTEATRFQENLANTLFQKVHQNCPPSESVADHVTAIITAAIDGLSTSPVFGPLLQERHPVVNGQPLQGFPLLKTKLPHWAKALDAEPQRRLHGDLILENILVPIAPGTTPPLLLIDPVSVAGIYAGPPLFDLVKYETYASGDLYAMRQGLTIHGTPNHGKISYDFKLCRDSPELRPFRSVDWLSHMRQRFVAHYGPISPKTYAVLDGYFALVMARNVSGNQQWARVLHGLMALNQACDAAD